MSNMLNPRPKSESAEVATLAEMDAAPFELPPPELPPEPLPEELLPSREALRCAESVSNSENAWSRFVDYPNHKNKGLYLALYALTSHER